MAKKSDVALGNDGVKLVGSGRSPEVEIEGGNHWNLAKSDGDLRIGDDTNMLKMGVALGGGGAGNAKIWATSKLKLGGEGASIVGIDKEGLYPERSDSLGTPENRWNAVHVEGSVHVGSNYESGEGVFGGLSGEGVLITKDLTKIPLLYVSNVEGDLTPRAGNSNLGDNDSRWDTLYVKEVNKSSDRRLKSDVEDLEDGLEAVLDLRPVSYTWRDDGDRTHLGFIGQEVADVLPEIVSGREGEAGHLGLDYTELVPVLVDAVQTQQDQKEELERRVEAQRELIDDLEERLAALEEAR